MRIENSWDKAELSELGALHTFAESKRGFVAYGNKYGKRFTVEKNKKAYAFNTAEECRSFMREGK